MRILILMVLLILIPLALAYEECQRVQDPADIPCEIISSWKPSNCTAIITIYNETPEFVDEINFTESTPFCTALFNISTHGSYTYNSSIEDGVIVVRSSDMWLIAILLIPLGLSFLFIFLSNSFTEEQEPIKWFLRLASLFMIIVLFVGARIAINQNPNYIGLRAMFNIEAATWIFYTIVAVALLFLIYKVFMSFQLKKGDELEKGILK